MSMPQRPEAGPAPASGSAVDGRVDGRAPEGPALGSAAASAAAPASVALPATLDRAGATSAAAEGDAEDGFGPARFATLRARPGPARPARIITSQELASVAAEALSPQQFRLARRIAQKRGIEVQSDIEAVVMLRRAGIDPFGRHAILALPPEGSPPDPGQIGHAGQSGQTPAPGQVAQAAQAGQNGGPAAPMQVPNGPDAPRPAPASAPPADMRTAAMQPAGAPRPGVPQSAASLPGSGVPARRPEPAPVPPASASMAAELREMQRDLMRRRRLRALLLALRLAFFVALPTALAGYYYAAVATPIFASNTEMVIQMADSPAQGAAGGLFAGSMVATVQDSVAVQGYLESREAMLRLDAEHGFRAAFSGPEIDPIQRLAEGASTEDAYRLYRRQVRISFDPTEGLIRMEVRAPTAALAMGWSRALIGYAEEQVDNLSKRLREDRMSGAREIYEGAEAAFRAAQARVIALQERYNVLSGDTEASLITSRISALEEQLLKDRIGLEELRANPAPNQARVTPIERRIAVLEAEIARLRARLTGGVPGEMAGAAAEVAGAGQPPGAMSLARVQGELMVAQSDMETRKMLLAQSLQQMEAARADASRQVRYLSVSVSPLMADAAIYPKAVENTALAALILMGVYLMLALTAAVLREQIAR